MFKNCKKVIVVIILIFFTYSCTMRKMIRIKDGIPAELSGIIGVVKKNSDWVEFSKESPAILYRGIIEGSTITDNGLKNKTQINLKDVKMIWIKKSSVSEGFLNFISMLGAPMIFSFPAVAIYSLPFVLVSLAIPL
ncbi:MAG: hypothetical protein ABFR36_01400 [Acidobacteriota bacterium]